MISWQNQCPHRIYCDRDILFSNFLLALQLMIINTYILKMAVLHLEAVRYFSDKNKTQALIKMTGMDIVLDNSIKLQQTESVFFSLLQAIGNKLFPNVQSTAR